MLRAHKIRMFPTESQVEVLKKACGVARFAYNWALTEWERLYALGEKTGQGILRKRLNACKREEFPWMMESTKCAPEQAIKNLGKAFSAFFENVKLKRKVGKKNPYGYPQKHKKGKCKESFYIANDKAKICGKEIFLPHCKEAFKLSEELRFSGKIMSYTISLDVDRWYVSVSVDTDEVLTRTANRGCIGIDLGIKTLATFSDEITFKAKKFYGNAEKKLKRLTRQLSRQTKGGKNRAKTKLKFARQHRKIRLARKDYLHKITTFATTKYNEIVLEDLNVKGMLKNHRLAKAINNMGFGMFRCMIENKAKQTSCVVTIADRYFPSSKTCCYCGAIKEDLTLKDRKYHCTKCHIAIDRDLNAAKNLEKLGVCCTSTLVDLTSDLEYSERLKKKQEFFEPEDL